MLCIFSFILPVKFPLYVATSVDKNETQQHWGRRSRWTRYRSQEEETMVPACGSQSIRVAFVYVCSYGERTDNNLRSHTYYLRWLSSLFSCLVVCLLLWCTPQPISPQTPSRLIFQICILIFKSHHSVFGFVWRLLFQITTNPLWGEHVNVCMCVFIYRASFLI